MSFSRPSQSTVEINRLLEKSVKDSRCIDTESLCIVAGAQVINAYNKKCVDFYILNERCVSYYNKN